MIAKISPTYHRTKRTLTAKMFGAKSFGENNLGEQIFGGFFYQITEKFGK